MPKASAYLFEFSNLLDFVVAVLGFEPRVIFTAESERKYIINMPFFLGWV